MSRRGTLPVVEASGKPFEMGRAVGKRCAKLAAGYKKGIAESIAHGTGQAWPHAVERAKLYLPHAEEFYPDYVEEIRGYAEGARQTFEEMFALCCHELLFPAAFRGCTDIVVNGDITSDGRVLVGHNEDWSDDQLDTVVLLHAKPKGKPEFFCTAYAGLLPSCGMNSSGVSLTGNALSQNDMRIGIPKSFPVRKALEARRIGEGLSFAMPPNRASSYNNIVTDRNGEIYDLEGSATECAWLYARDGYLVHTNHYTAEKMQRFELEPDSITTSVFRYNRALRLIEDQLGAVTVDSLSTIFRDHVNKPGSICRHMDPGIHRLDGSETIFSVIFDLTNLEAHICKGHPCDGTYVRHSLRR
jgi:isopenicillin-N N-acyltransferase-like protein